MSDQTSRPLVELKQNRIYFYFPGNPMVTCDILYVLIQEGSTSWNPARQQYSPQHITYFLAKHISFAETTSKEVEGIVTRKQRGNVMVQLRSLMSLAWSFLFIFFSWANIFWGMIKLCPLFQLCRIRADAIVNSFLSQDQRLLDICWHTSQINVDLLIIQK